MSQQNLWDFTMHVIDFEGNLESGIVEFGVVTLSRGQIQNVTTQICRAVRPIDSRESQVHGILTEDTLAYPFFKDQWAFFSQLRSNGPFFAHNATYEDMLIRAIWPYCSEVPRFLKPNELCNEWGPWGDSCELYRQVFPGLESYRLSALVNAFKLQEELDHVAAKLCPMGRKKYHCALYDALASALLMKALGQHPHLQSKGVEWLLVNSMSSRQKRQDHSQLTLF